MKIFYVHDIGSSCSGNTVKILKKYYPDEDNLMWKLVTRNNLETSLKNIVHAMEDSSND